MPQPRTTRLHKPHGDLVVNNIVDDALGIEPDLLFVAPTI